MLGIRTSIFPNLGGSVNVDRAMMGPGAARAFVAGGGSSRSVSTCLRLRPELLSE